MGVKGVDMTPAAHAAADKNGSLSQKNAPKLDPPRTHSSGQPTARRPTASALQAAAQTKQQQGQGQQRTTAGAHLAPLIAPEGAVRLLQASNVCRGKGTNRGQGRQSGQATLGARQTAARHAPISRCAWVRAFAPASCCSILLRHQRARPPVFACQLLHPTHSQAATAFASTLSKASHSVRICRAALQRVDWLGGRQGGALPAGLGCDAGCMGGGLHW